MYSLKVADEELILVESEPIEGDHAPTYVTYLTLSLDKMTQVIPNLDLTLLEDEKQFMLAEFPDKTFEVIDGHIVMDDINAPAGTMRNSVIAGIEYYLTDLNGDGKREICSTAAMGSGIVDERVYAYDFANERLYTLCGRFECDYRLELRGDVLFYVKSETFSGGETLSEPLTLDKMKEVDKSEI